VSLVLLQAERESIVEFGKRISSSGLTKGTSGNLSIFDLDTRLMAIGPSGIGYYETRPEDVVIMNLEGDIVDGDKKPSSEYVLHATFYRKRPGVCAIVHTHSTYATTFASMRVPIKAVHYVIGTSGSATVPCAEYATYGTPELAENALRAMGDAKAVLLANHGLVTVGPTLAEAFSLAENAEFVAEIYYRTLAAGSPFILSDEEMDRVIGKFKTYGQPKKE
jgi:L-fuculose-phosphate aldolase